MQRIHNTDRVFVMAQMNLRQTTTSSVLYQNHFVYFKFLNGITLTLL